MGRWKEPDSPLEPQEQVQTEGGSLTWAWRASGVRHGSGVRGVHGGWCLGLGCVVGCGVWRGVWCGVWLGLGVVGCRVRCGVGVLGGVWDVGCSVAVGCWVLHGVSPGTGLTLVALGEYSRARHTLCFLGSSWGLEGRCWPWGAAFSAGSLTLLR